MEGEAGQMTEEEEFEFRQRLEREQGRQPKAQPAPMKREVDDPGILGTLGIGAGRTVDQVLDGLTQWLLQARGEESALKGLKQNNADKNEAYKPLQELRPIATAVGESLPAMAIPVGASATLPATVAKLAATGAVPGMLEYGTAGERAKRGAIGATGAVAGGVVVPKLVETAVKGVPAVGRGIRAAVEPLTEKGRTAIAGRTLVNAAGDDAATVAQRLAQAGELVPGSVPTAAQIAENGGLAALERSVSAANPAAFTERGMEQAAARTAALRGIAKDDTARAAAVLARKAQTGPMYQQAAREQVDVDAALSKLLKRPSVQKALDRARKIAEEEGRKFEFPAASGHAHGAPKVPAGPAGIVDESGNVLVDLTAKQGPQKVSGQTLQDLKMGMDALLSDPTAGIAKHEADLIKATRGQLMNWMEGRIPILRTARTEYADMSKGIGQMDVGRQLLKDIEPALSDYGALGKETAAKYGTALRNADQTAVKATKFKGTGMRDLMTPDQMGTIEAVASDLARKANAQDLGRGVGSDTFQKLALSNIAERSGAPGVVGTALDLPGVSKVAKFLYREPEEKIQTLIAKSLLDPKNAAQLMDEAIKAGKPQPIGNLLFSNPSRAAQITGALPALATTELFSR
jgi:uncharacterized Zn-binding protein involved in type VI secretion